MYTWTLVTRIVFRLHRTGHAPLGPSGKVPRHHIRADPVEGPGVLYARHRVVDEGDLAAGVVDAAGVRG